MGNDELNQIKDQFINIQNELARLNQSTDDIKTYLEQDRKISQSRWVSNTGYMVVGLGIAALGMSATSIGSATTILSGIGMIIFGMALQSVSALLYPKRKRRSKQEKSPVVNKSLDINWRNTMIGLTALAIILAVKFKSK